MSDLTMTAEKLGEYLDVLEKFQSFINITLADGLEKGFLDAVAQLCGDSAGWIGRYAYENDFGRHELEAGFDGDMRPIKNVNDLWRLIKENKRRGER